jgi:hypothetical protein
MTRQGQSITLSLSATDKAKLEQLAAEFGLTWGEKPNISKLVKAIARSELRIAPNHDWDSRRIDALETARQVLIDADKNLEAQEIAKLLCERSELKIPLRDKLQGFLEHPQPQWRQQLEKYIRRQQPFRLTYQDAQEKIWSFTVLYARIQPIEKRQYLLCRCAESEGHQDLPELAHNRTLRLDRLQEAALAPLEQRWLSAPETIPVTFHLKGGLAFAYEQKPDDLEVSLEEDPPIRRVVRQIYSLFWFLRDIAPYYADCEIIAPEVVRQRHQETINKLSQLYSHLEITTFGSLY